MLWLQARLKKTMTVFINVVVYTETMNKNGLKLRELTFGIMHWKQRSQANARERWAEHL